MTNIKARWIEFIYKLASGGKRTRMLLTPVGAVIFGMFTAVFIFTALAFDRWLGFPRMLSMPISVYLSLLPFLFGGVITAWSVIHFLKVKGTPVPANPPPSLVTTGPYNFSRNPMLMGIFILLFETGIMLGSISLAFIFTPLFVLLNIWELKVIEEPELVKRFGEDYVAYRERTPMFIPRLKRY